MRFKTLFVSMAFMSTLFFASFVYSQLSTTKGPTVGGEHAIAPEALLATRIADMKVGDKFGTSPEALLVDEDRRAWLNPRYVVADTDEAPLTVKRDKDGYQVEINDKKLRWAKVSLDSTADERELKKTLIPVRSLILRGGKEK